MKSRLFIVLVLVMSLAFILAWSVAAQGPEPPDPPPPRAEDGAKPFFHPAASGDRGTQGVNAAASLGQPGLSFRYVETFGVTEQAYISDTAHIAWPRGVGTDGTNVWIAGTEGNRALKFNGSDGAFITQIGKPGFRDATGQSIEYVTDVAVDAGGNVWVVDAEAAHILKFDSGGNYVSELGKAWNRGTANDRFNAPLSIAFDSSGNIYVSDGDQWSDSSGNQRLQIFDSSGAYLNTIGESGVSGSDNSHFKGPRHIAVYSNTLYVADRGNHRVQIFDISNPAAPGYVATLGVTGEAGSDNSHFDWPSGVAVDSNLVYVADSYNHRIQVFHRATLAYVGSIGAGWGTGNTQFNTPTDVAVDSGSNFYVADQGNARVQQFDPGWNYVRTYGATGAPYLTDGYHYNRPRGVAVATDGSIYLVENRGHRLLKLSATGAPQWTVGEAGTGGGDNAHFRWPAGVALDGAGRVYVADTVNHRVQIYNSDGAYIATLGTGQGSGDYEFGGAYGVYVDANGNIYVADSDNHRVQIYDSNRAYVATLGETGVAGADNAHFSKPRDVVVDPAGNIYVVDYNNHRVQVFDSNRTYLRTIGETGVEGDDFDHLKSPEAVAVDAAGRIYVADQWGQRVQVFDQNGAYLTTATTSRGNATNQAIEGKGLALDNAGNLYVADYLGHQIQKFAPGAPGWMQSNINGFGDKRNGTVTTLAPFNGYLYAGTYNSSGNGAQLWQTGSPWTAVITNGFGDTTNAAIDHLIEFKGNLYAGTWNWDFANNRTTGGQIWRSSTGTMGGWAPSLLPGDQAAGTGSLPLFDSTNGEFFRLAVFSDTLYASTWSYTSAHGTEIWRSSSGDRGSWSRVVANGFGNANNSAASFEVFNGYLYAGTSAGDVWRADNGITWTASITGGFGDANNRSAMALQAFNGYLYAGTYNYYNSDNPGAELWRCQMCDGSDWAQVSAAKGFGDTENWSIRSLVVFDSKLYAFTYNRATGMEIWQTKNGTDWTQTGPDGLGDSNNYAPYWDNSTAVFNNSLYVGTWNDANGGEIWHTARQIYLPLVLK